MGASFDSIHIRTENSDSVQKALEQVAKGSDCKFLLGPAINGWTSVFTQVTFNRAIELKPDLTAAYSSRGKVKEAKGDLDGAQTDYNKVIELKRAL
jgi:hypothetical protein